MWVEADRRVEAFAAGMAIKVTVDLFWFFSSIDEVVNVPTCFPDGRGRSHNT